MAKTQRCLRTTEADAVALQAVVNKALGYPRRGVQVGKGIHVDSPETWDGTGARPPGWTVDAVRVWVADGAAVIALEDDTASELQRAGTRIRLSASEKDQLDAALAAREDVDLETEGFAVKRRPEEAAAEAAAIALLAEPAAPVSTGKLVAIGVAALAAVAAAYEIASQLGLF